MTDVEAVEVVSEYNNMGTLVTEMIDNFTTSGATVEQLPDTVYHEYYGEKNDVKITLMYLIACLGIPGNLMTIIVLG